MNQIIKLKFTPFIYSAEFNEKRNHHSSECCKCWISGGMFYITYPRKDETHSRISGNFLDIWAG